MEDNHSHFMGHDGFTWFVGVVEDRIDPLQLGRVRIRCLGFHSESYDDIATADLPWAHVMHPVTDPSMQGLGNTPSFITEGSWIVGFFRDNEFQQPVVMGTLPGIPGNDANSSKGFNDPRGARAKQKDYAGKPTYGPYPGDRESNHGVGEPDTSKLARGKASEGHSALIRRRNNRLRGDPVSELGPDDDVSEASGIPTATKPFLTNTNDVDSTTFKGGGGPEERGFWEEPNPKGVTENSRPYVSGVYPYNHVFESESGHITEIDDSPGAERLYREHQTGTFEELLPDGSRTIKIMKDNYEIVIGQENIYIKGAQNITIEGTVRELIKGDYIQEIEGNFFQKIHKNHRIKVGAKKDPITGEGIPGNREEEITGNFGYSIGQSVRGWTGEDVDNFIVGKETRTINGTLAINVVGDINVTTLSSMVQTAKTDFAFSTVSGIVSMKSGSTLNIKSGAAMTIFAEGTLDSSAKTVHTIRSGGAIPDGKTNTPTATNSVQINP